MQNCKFCSLLGKFRNRPNLLYEKSVRSLIVRQRTPILVRFKQLKCTREEMTWFLTLCSLDAVLSFKVRSFILLKKLFISIWKLFKSLAVQWNLIAVLVCMRQVNRHFTWRFMIHRCYKPLDKSWHKYLAMWRQSNPLFQVAYRSLDSLSFSIPVGY